MSEAEDDDLVPDDNGEPDQVALPSLNETLRSLPLVEDDHYIGMQATNLAIVEAMLQPMEEDLAGDYWVNERVPIDKFMSVSALTQLWVLGVYEFLRTWRQWVEDVLARCAALDELDPLARASAIERERHRLRQATPESPGGVPYAAGFGRAATDDVYRARLLDALYRSDIPFRRIEALRVHLAKHETPKGNQYASGAGYGRIGHDRSIQFQIPLGKREVTALSRRDISSDLRNMRSDHPLCVLTPAIQMAIEKLPQSSYGIRRVLMTLDDGSVYEGAIAWRRHIVWVKGFDMPPFSADRVVQIKEAPRD